MKILYTGLEHTNYNPKLGKSFEHHNFYLALKEVPGVEVIYFPYEKILELGREKGNAALLELVRREKPDFFFAFLFTDELLPGTLDEIKKLTISAAWLSDDHWRFDNYSKHYAPHFTWIVTTYSKAVKRYKKLGINRVILSQWAANTKLYVPAVDRLIASDRPDVCFVGGWSKPRQRIVDALQKAGIKVSTFGGGWPGGRVSNDQMIRLFSISKINLGLNPPPGFFNKNSLGRLLYKRSMDKIVFDWQPLNNFRCWLNRGVPQIKARHFEIPACHGFLMTGPADNLEDYLQPGKEAVIYYTIPDMIEKIKYYLAHDAKREEIAKAGYERTIKEHTYAKRFEKIFSTIFPASTRIFGEAGSKKA